MLLHIHATCYSYRNPSNLKYHVLPGKSSKRPVASTSDQRTSYSFANLSHCKASFIIFHLSQVYLDVSLNNVAIFRAVFPRTHRPYYLQHRERSFCQVHIHVRKMTNFCLFVLYPVWLVKMILVNSRISMLR